MQQQSKKIKNGVSKKPSGSMEGYGKSSSKKFSPAEAIIKTIMGTHKSSAKKIMPRISKKK